MNSRSHKNAERIIEAVIALPPVPSLVVDPCDESSLAGAIDADKARRKQAAKGGVT